MKGFYAFFGCIGFILGCAFFKYLHSINIVGIIILFVVFLIISFKKSPRIGVYFLLIFVFVFSIMSLRIPLEVGEMRTYTGVIIEKKENYYVFLSSFNRFYVYEKGSVREVGDFLSIQGKANELSFYSEQSQFNFGEYLNDRGVYYELVPTETIKKFLRPIRLEANIKEFLTGFSVETRSLLNAICFSKVDYSSPVISDSQSMSLLFVISGGGFLYGGLLRFFEKIIGKKLDVIKTKSIVFAIGVVLLLPLGNKAGIYRVILIRGIELYSLIRNKDFTRFQIISYAAAIMLLLNRFYAFDQGFLIGFACSFASALTSPLFLGMKKIKRKMAARSLQLLIIFPLASSEGEYHVFNFIYLIFFSPLVIGFAISGYLSFIGLPIRGFVEGYALFIQNVISFLKTIDFSLPISLNGFYQSLGYYSSIVAFLFLYEIGFKRAAKYIALLSSLSIILLSSPLGNGISQEVTFINVGQGDAILIRDGYRAAMIDTGGIYGKDIAKEVDIPLLKKHKVYSLDYLIASHGDFDHIGGKDSLIANFNVKKYIDDKSFFPLKMGGITFVNHNIFDGKDENDNSLVLEAKIMGKVFLFTGDASIEIEKKIISRNPGLDVDVLKAGHHGSKTSSCKEFLECITPEVAIISCGKNNRYGHPHKEVIERMESMGIKIRRTDLEGTITYKKTIFEKTLNLYEGGFVYNNHWNDYSYLYRTAQNGRKRSKRLN
ncbi:MAG: MBL fold metallo-hydrolase [Bacilli bacterium]|nr:MBL fold metallo-hydrolase [Bacilli bacterium]